VADVREFLVPDLGEGLEDAQIVRWHVGVGDVIELNQDVCEVETAKALVAIPSPFEGRVVERFGEVGETVDVGKALLRIEVAGDTSQASAAQPAAAPAEPQRTSVLVGYGAEQGTGSRRRRAGVGPDRRDGGPERRSSTTKALAKPPVRKLAKDLQVDLDGIAPGSGPHGTITREDVQAAASAGAGAAARPADRLDEPGTAPGPRAGERIPLRGIRGRIAQKMVTSRTEIPEATCSITIDCTDLVATAKELTEASESNGTGIKVTPLALVLKATAIALRQFPEVNSRLDSDAQEIVLLEDINLGVAMDTERGLIVPVIKDAEARSVLDLGRELLRLVEAGRSGSIRPEDLTGGTFTVNNYGALGTEDGEPIINHPEAAILGIGAIQERPWVVDGEIAVRRVARLTLAFDHRIFDGGAAARFLTFAGRLIERPSRLLLHA
jgi:pyruvate dehydrogenase E2 component (dihydrolipoamide acetyltransferase)